MRKRYFTNGKPSPVSTLHAPYMQVAQTLLGLVKQRMQMGNLQQLWQQYTTEDGATIRAISRFGQDEIWIDVPHVAPNPQPWIERKAQYGRFLVATGPHGNIYQLDPQSLRLKLATDLVFEGCPGHIAATTEAIAITDNLADYYKYGAQEWTDLFNSRAVLHPKLRFYGRDWTEKEAHTPYTVYGEEFATGSAYYGLAASPNEFMSIYSISRFWGWAVGGDYNYYYDRFKSTGDLLSHLDIWEWSALSLCHDQGKTYAELMPALVNPDGNTYVTPGERHLARMTPDGPEYTIKTLQIHSLAAMDGRIYGLYVADASTGQYAIGILTETGELERSVSVPIYAFDSDFNSTGGSFPFGRIAAGEGRVVAVNRPTRNTYVLHVFDSKLNPLKEIPVPVPAGFGEADVIFNGNNYPVLAGDFNTAIGYDPYWIPEHLTEKRPDFGAK